MRLISRWTMAAGAADWCRESCDDPIWGADYERIAAALAALGDGPNPDDVDRLVGSTDWTTPGWCGECGASPDELVLIGKQDEDGYGEILLCAACVLKALILIDQ